MQSKAIVLNRFIHARGTIGDNRFTLLRQDFLPVCGTL
jgi:hypothetical protein